jgi:hypothetical protein
MKPYDRKLAKDRVARGLCFDGKHPRGEDGTKTRCRFHADKKKSYGLQYYYDHREQSARKRTEKIEAGLCGNCSKKRGKHGTDTLCRRCAHKMLNRYYANKTSRPVNV